MRSSGPRAGIIQWITYLLVALSLVWLGTSCADVGGTVDLAPGCYKRASDGNLIQIDGDECKTEPPASVVPDIANEGGPLRRLPDGSFTLHVYNFTNNQAVKTIPNIQSRTPACYAPRTVTRPQGWSFLSETLGVASMSIVTGDFAANGVPTLIGYGLVPNTLNVVNGNQDFTLKSQTTSSVTQPVGVLAADLNADGKRDAVVVTAGVSPAPGSLLIYTGKGDGTLNPPTTIALNGRGISATIFDFNGDNKRDIAVLVDAADFTGVYANIFLGLGNGSFQAPARFQVTSGATAIAVADINGDSRGDLVVAAYTSVDILYGNGNGTFQDARSIVPNGFNAFYVAAGDFNRDGKQDLALADFPAGSIAVWYGNGDATFPTQKRYAGLAGEIPLMVFDFDWDGNLDIVQASGHPDYITPNSPYFGILHNKGGNDGFCAGSMYNAGIMPMGALVDVNADARLDVITTSSTGGINASLGQGNGTFAAPVNSPTGGQNQPTGAIVTGDFNSDGKVDAIATVLNSAAAQSLLFYPGNGNGTFGIPASRNGGAQPAWLAAADFNADNKLDLAIGQGSAITPSTANSILVSLGNGDGSFQNPVTYSPCVNPIQVQAADLNSDQKLDLIVTCGATSNSADVGGIVVLTGAGDGTFTVTPKITVNTVRSSAAIADFDNDGKLDIFTGGGNTLSFLAGRANGTFATAVTSPGATAPVIAVDFTLDGRRDIIVSRDSNLGYCAGLGNGKMDTCRKLMAGGQLSQALSGDLNGDNKPDLIALNSNFGVPPTGGSSFVVLLNVSDQPGAILTSPANNSTLTAASTTFNWTSVTGASYKLEIGNSLGAADLFTTTTSNTSQAVTLPADGRTMHLQLTTIVNGTARQPYNYVFTAASAAQAAAISSPVPGATLTGGTATFTWNAITGASYRLDIGNTAGATDIFTATTSTTSQNVTGLPQDGRNLFVKLSTTVNGVTGTNSYTYKASNAAVAVLTSPAPASALTGPTVNFTWSAALGATQYKLDIGNSVGGTDIFTVTTAALSQSVNNLPTDGRTIYIRLATFLSGVAQTPLDYTVRASGGGLRFVSLPPCRVMETRAEYNFEGRTGAFGPPSLARAETRTMNLPVSNVCSIPATAKAYVVNVTLIPKGSVDFVTVWPAGETRPNVYTVRSPDGNTVANSAIVRAGSNGGISVYASDPADLLIDISGYYTDNAALSNLAYYPLAPCRVIDTRILYRSPAGPFGPPTIGRAETRSFRFPATPYCTIPNGAAAYSMTITVVPPGPLPFLTAWPSSGSQPNVSSINSFIGRVLANSVIVPASSNGSINVFTYETSDFIIDINGYYAPDDGVNGLFYFPVTQCRAADSTAYADDSTRTIAIPSAAGCSGIPTTAKGYALNITAIPGGSPMPFITAYPTGQPRPNASILNAFEGQTVTNSAIVPAGTAGAVDIYAFRRTNIIVEVSGYFGR